MKRWHFANTHGSGPASRLGYSIRGSKATESPRQLPFDLKLLYSLGGGGGRGGGGDCTPLGGGGGGGGMQQSMMYILVLPLLWSTLLGDMEIRTFCQEVTNMHPLFE